MKSLDDVGDPRTFQLPCPVACIIFLSEDIRFVIKSRSRRKTEQMYKTFWHPIFGIDDRLLARFTGPQFMSF